MKKCVLALVAFALLLAGCSAPARYPEEGIWYCEGLDIYLNMENSTGVYRNNDGEYRPVEAEIDYGTGFFIHFYENSVDEESYDMLRTDYEYKDGVLRLTDREDGTVYEFIEVAKEQYPGG